MQNRKGMSGKSLEKKSPSDGLCGTCQNLFDRRYCMAWREIVPEAINDCDRWKDNNEVPF